MHRGQLKELIEVVLIDAGLYSIDAVDLLMGTAAVESKLGFYIKQIGGPAKGIFQMEPATERDIHENFIRYSSGLKLLFGTLGYKDPDEERLMYDLRYQILMARLHYLRVPEKIPSSIIEKARYWKDHYNTSLGKGTVGKYLQSYKNLVEGV